MCHFAYQHTLVDFMHLIGLRETGPLGSRKLNEDWVAEAQYVEALASSENSFGRWAYEGATGRRFDFGRFLSRGVRR